VLPGRYLGCYRGALGGRIEGVTAVLPLCCLGCYRAVIWDFTGLLLGELLAVLLTLLQGCDQFVLLIIVFPSQ